MARKSLLARLHLSLGLLAVLHLVIGLGRLVKSLELRMAAVEAHGEYGEEIGQMLYDRLWVALCICVVVQITVSILLNRYLRLNHGDVWNELGQPTMFNNSIHTSIRQLQFFIFSSRYKNLHDETVNAYVLLLRVMFALTLCAFAFTIAFLYRSDIGE